MSEVKAAGDLFVGIDIGTSGVRAIAIDVDGTVAGEAAAKLPAPERVDGAITQDPQLWWDATLATLRWLTSSVKGAAIRSVAVDGTSGTILVADEAGWPLGPALMYNDASAAGRAAAIAAVAPPESGAHGASSALAKLLRLCELHPDARRAWHQADWIAGRLAGGLWRTDENNALKTGYDVLARRWPHWFDALGVNRFLLPEVDAPGTARGTVGADAVRETGLPASCVVVAGTTDGCASFLATGAAEPGEGVTALGSTLTLKLLSDAPIFAPAYGVYSHRLGDIWLVGGASNTGGSVLRGFFDDARLAELTPQLRPEVPTGLDYYPLPAPGERFPIADPAMQPRLTPRPADDAVFLQGLLEGIAGIEAHAYTRLAELGAAPIRSVRSVGGGAANPAWTTIRNRLLGVPMKPSREVAAAYGAALLARSAVLS